MFTYYLKQKPKLSTGNNPLYSICVVEVVDEIPEITEVDATCDVTEVDGFEDGEATKR